jgi:hypothetical protein
MDRHSFHIPQAADGWFIDEPGGRSISYASREAAFEALSGPVANMLKEGEAIEIVIDPPGSRDGTNEVADQDEPQMIPG